MSRVHPDPVGNRSHALPKDQLTVASLSFFDTWHRDETIEFSQYEPTLGA